LIRCGDGGEEEVVLWLAARRALSLLLMTVRLGVDILLCEFILGDLIGVGI